VEVAVAMQASTVPVRPKRKEVVTVKHFLSTHNITSRADLEDHVLAHKAELAALQVCGWLWLRAWLCLRLLLVCVSFPLFGAALLSLLLRHAPPCFWLQDTLNAMTMLPRTDQAAHVLETMRATITEVSPLPSSQMNTPQ
jgi:hypothetical protein